MIYTAENIRDIEFQKSGFGSYKASDVNAFVEEVASDYESMQQKNEELIAKLRILAETVEEYRKNEDTVKTAILTAQRTANSMMRDAEANMNALINEKTLQAEQLEKTSLDASEKLMSDAQEKAKELLDEATMKAKSIVAEANTYAEKKQVEAEKLIGQQLLTYNYIKDELKKFKEEIITKYKEHLDSLQSVPMQNKSLETYEEKLENERLTESEQQTNEDAVINDEVVEVADVGLDDEMAFETVEEPVEEMAEELTEEPADIDDTIIVE